MKNKKTLTKLYALAGGIVGIAAIVWIAITAQTSLWGASLTKNNAAQTYKSLETAQLPFIENNGQTDPAVKYFSQLLSGTFFVEQNGTLTYSFLVPGAAKHNEAEDVPPHHLPVDREFSIYAVKENFQTAKKINPLGKEPTDTSVNYFIGNDQSKWKTNVANYNVIDLGEVFDGVNVQLKAHGKNVEKIFTVAPHANPANIQMKLAGADNISVNAQGELELATSQGVLKFTKPVAYQQINGQKQTVEANYKISGKDGYGFDVKNYDENSELIIDPLLGATYIGGSNFEGEKEVLGGNANMIISGGSLYLTAYTCSANFPTTVGAYQTTKASSGSGCDAFVSKFSSNLGSLQASTFLGGTGGEGETTLDADSSGNIFIIGNTSSTDFPGTSGHFQPSKAANQDAFIAKLNSSLSSLLAATYLGGSGGDWGNAIMIDDLNDRVYVSVDGSTGFPQGTDAGFDHTMNGSYNLVVAELDNNLSTSFYKMTFLGSGNYYGALAQDPGADIYLTGGCHGGTISSAIDGPITSPGASDGIFPIVRAVSGTPSYQEARGGSCDSFVARFSTDLTTLKATTLFGGPNWENDFTDNIVFHGVSGPIANEQIFITGDSYNTNSSVNGGLKQALENNSHTIDNNPGASKVATYGPLSDTTPNGDDVYVARFDRNLQTAATAIIGGTNTDNIPFITLNSNGEVYLTADAYSSDFPTTTGAYSTDPDGGEVDLIGAKFSNDLGTLLGSSYITGPGYDNYPGSIVVDETGGSENVYINGETTSTSLPGASSGYQTTNAGGGDIFISEFNCDFAKVCPPTNLGATAGDAQVALIWEAPVGNNVAITDYEIHYSTDGFASNDQIFNDGVSTAASATVTGLSNGTPYSFRVKSKTGSGDLSPFSNTANATPAVVLSQNSRWRNDNGSESTATYAAAENTTLTNVPKNTTQRLRFGVEGTDNGFYQKATLALPLFDNAAGPAVTDTSAGYAYFALDYYDQTHPEGIVKIRLSDFTRIGTTYVYNNEYGEGGITAGVIDPSAGYAYFVTQNDRFGGSRSTMYKIRLSDFALVDSLFLGTLSYGVQAGVIDTTHATHYAYFGTNSGKVIKVDLNTFTVATTLDLSSDGTFSSGVIDTTAGFAYFATTGSPAKIVKVDVNPANFARIGAVTLNSGENYILTSVIDPGNGYAYFGTAGGSPIKVIKVDINPANTFARIGAITVNGYSSAVIDAANGYAYFTANDVTSKIDINPAHTFAVADSITLSSTYTSHSSYGSATIDPASGYAYYGSGGVGGAGSHGGEIAKVSIGTHPSATYRLEYGLKSTSCAAITSWTQVPATASSEAWSMSDSGNITDGAATTNSSGLTDLGTVFVAGEIHDTTSQTNAITLPNATNFTEIEYSIDATNNAASGSSYCFRVTDAGSELAPPINYAEASVAASAPAQITDLALTPGNGQAALSWTAPNNNGSAITAYAVHYSTDNFVSNDVTCSDASCTDTTTGATVPGLTNGTTYSFRVFAVNAIGTSPASNTVSTPTAAPVYSFQFGSCGSGDGQFSYPQGVAVDTAGNIYVASENSRVEKFNASGTYLLRVGGTYGTGDGQVRYPYGLATDAAGNVYVVDSENHRIQKFNSAGVYQSQFGTQGTGNGQFYGPQGIALDAAGNIYVTDTGNNRVEIFNSAGAYLDQFGTSGSGDGQFNNPFGIALDPAGNIYVTDLLNYRVQIFNSSGVYQSQFGTSGSGDGQFNWPYGIAIDPTGNIYVTDFYNHRVQIFNSSGDYLTQFGSFGSGNGQFRYAVAIAIDDAGKVYVTDNNNCRIQVFTPPSAPAQITNLSANGGDGQVTLTWSAPNNGGSAIIEYEVHYSTDNFSSNNVTCSDASCPDTTTGATVTGLTNGTPYSFRVFAINALGISPASNTANATPTVSGNGTSNIEIHVSSVNAGVGSPVTVGISDATAAPRSAGHFINSFGSPIEGADLGLLLPKAVRYSFDGAGLVSADETITYNPDVFDGSATLLSDPSGPNYDDDYVGPAITLPFSLNMFGVTTDQIIIGSNGYIYVASDPGSGFTLGANPEDCCQGEDMSLQNTHAGNNFMIAGEWTDIYPAGHGTIKTEEFGSVSTQDHRFVIGFTDISKCCDTIGGNTFQIKLFDPANTPVGSPPDAITDLAATPGDSQVSLTWTAPNDNGSLITGYSIYYGESGGPDICDPTTSPYTNCLTQNISGLNTSSIVTGLTNDTQYIFAVYAQNDFGAGPVSNTVTATPSVSANCPGLGPNETCAVSRITGGGSLYFSDIPDNTSFTNAQNNTNLPSYNNMSGTDDHDIMSVTDLRDDPGVGFEVQLSASPFVTPDNLYSIPLNYLYVASSLPRTAGATEDETEGVEYAPGCFGATNNITSSVNVTEPLTPNELGTLSTFTNYGSNLGSGNTTVPVVLMSSPSSQRRCTMSQAISYAVDLPSYISALGTNIPPGTYAVTFTYTLIATSAPVAPQITFTNPTNGQAVTGPDVMVNYTPTSATPGLPAEVNHVHLQLDLTPGCAAGCAGEIRDTDFDGSYQFTGLTDGSHHLEGYLARVDHSEIAGTRRAIDFTTGPGAPAIVFTNPNSFAIGGDTIGGPNVTINYLPTSATPGLPAEVNHVHLQFDDAPGCPAGCPGEVRDLDFDGSYTITFISFGLHHLEGYLARADHTEIAGTRTATDFYLVPAVNFTYPTNGITVAGSTVDVTYTPTTSTIPPGTAVNHVHLQLDKTPGCAAGCAGEVRDLDFDGNYQFTGLSSGLHHLEGYLADASHVEIPNTRVAIDFTVP